MTPVQSAYLSLLRTAIWGTKEDWLKGQEAERLKDIDWPELLHLCAIQGTAPLVYNQLLLLSPSQVPDLTDDMRIQLKQHCLSNMLNQQRLQSILTTVWSALQHPAEGEPVHPVLLKGFGLAQLYPQPYLRTWGDLDVYVGPAQYHRAAALLRDAFPQAKHHDEEWEELKHYNFVLPSGDSIEMHRITIAFLSRRDQAYYQRLEDEAMDRPDGYDGRSPGLEDAALQFRERHGVPTEACGYNHQSAINIQQSSIQIGDLTCALPEPQFNLLFVFLHAWNHFVYEGVGYKQLCDLALLARMLMINDERLTNNDKHSLITYLSKHLRRLHMLEPWQLIGYVLIHSLNLSPAEWPLYHETHHVRKYGERLLTCILNGGQVRHKDQSSIAQRASIQQSAIAQRASNRYEARDKALKMNILQRKFLTLKGKLSTARSLRPYCPRYARYFALTDILRGLRRTLRGEKMEVMY